MTKARLVIPTLLVLLGSAGLARADAIDGDWCKEDGRHFTIKGSEITTPGGTVMAGTYSRHAFSYTTPASDIPSGVAILMTLANETTVRLREGTDPSAPVQIWTRCQPVS